jgi:hypothetical protein
VSATAALCLCEICCIVVPLIGLIVPSCRPQHRIAGIQLNLSPCPCIVNDDASAVTICHAAGAVHSGKEHSTWLSSHVSMMTPSGGMLKKYELKKSPTGMALHNPKQSSNSSRSMQIEQH